jgi:RNA polymerase sigma factor (sigma-70 family)
MKSLIRTLYTSAVALLRTKQSVQLRYDADDLVQETLCRGLKHPPIATSQRALLKFLQVTMLNIFRDARRQANRRPQTSTNLDLNAMPAREEASAVIRELTRKIDAAVLELPDETRKAWQLTFVDELSAVDAAKQLRMTRKRVKTLSDAALRHLRSALAPIAPEGASAGNSQSIP